MSKDDDGLLLDMVLAVTAFLVSLLIAAAGIWQLAQGNYLLAVGFNLIALAIMVQVLRVCISFVRRFSR